MPWGLLGVIGNTLLVVSLIAAMAVGAHSLRRVRNRHCPKCRHIVIDGLRCPECGFEGKNESSFWARRRRWGLIAGLLVCSALGHGLRRSEAIAERGAVAAIPSVALVNFCALGGDWAWDELFLRDLSAFDEALALAWARWHGRLRVVVTMPEWFPPGHRAWVAIDLSGLDRLVFVQHHWGFVIRAQNGREISGGGVEDRTLVGDFGTPFALLALGKPDPDGKVRVTITVELYRVPRRAPAGTELTDGELLSKEEFKFVIEIKDPPAPPS